MLINENAHMISPYISEECLAEDSELKKWRSSKGSSDDEYKGPTYQLLIIFKSNCEKFEMKRCFLSQLVDHHSCVSVDLDYPKKPHRCIEIVSSCKGQVFIILDE